MRSRVKPGTRFFENPNGRFRHTNHSGSHADGLQGHAQSKRAGLSTGPSIHKSRACYSWEPRNISRNWNMFRKLM